MNAVKRIVTLVTLIMLAAVVLSTCGPTPTPEPEVVVETAPPEVPTSTPIAPGTCANVWSPYYSSGNNYLGVVDSCPSAYGLIIAFVTPVDSVSLRFSGASTSYILQVYDESGTLLGKEVQKAEFNNGDGSLFEIGYTSSLANIGHVQFGGPSGGPQVVIAVREITFSRGGIESKHNFDRFPDGTIIAADSVDSQGRRWRSLTGNEFEEWGFWVGTNFAEQGPNALDSLAEDEWTKIEVDWSTGVGCADDKDGQEHYWFWVFRNRDELGTSDRKLLIHFAGGGACWDYRTCTGKEGDVLSDMSAQLDKLENSKGVFGEDGRNPLQGYTIVHIPYCTWDLHWGSNDKEYIAPTPTPPLSIKHRGFKNVEAVLEWVYTNFEAPESVVIIGTSAGSLGSILHTPYIIHNYASESENNQGGSNEKAETTILHIGDSGVLFPPDGDLQDPYSALGRFEFAPLKVPNTTYLITATNGIDLAAFYAAVANSYPDHRFALFNYAQDCVQNAKYQRFYNETMGTVDLIKWVIDDPPPFITETVEIIHTLCTEGNFYSYTETEAECTLAGKCKLASGGGAATSCHTILGTSLFYELEVDTVPLLGWVSNLVNGLPASHEVAGMGKRP